MDIASDKLASDLVLLDLRGMFAFADYFILANGESTPQLNAIADSVEEELKKLGVRLHHREGTPEEGWLLLDYGDTVVHVFDPVARNYYGLDRLWREAPALLKVQ